MKDAGRAIWRVRHLLKKYSKSAYFCKSGVKYDILFPEVILVTEYQQKMTEELKLTLEELDGDILALENFCRCVKKNAKDFSTDSMRAYLKRTLDYVRQHTQDVRQIAEFLYGDMAAWLDRTKTPGQT